MKTKLNTVTLELTEGHRMVFQSAINIARLQRMYVIGKEQGVPMRDTVQRIESVTIE